jgi:hypothetical protein
MSPRPIDTPSCVDIWVPDVTVTVTMPWRVATPIEPLPTLATTPEMPLRVNCPGAISAPDESSVRSANEIVVVANVTDRAAMAAIRTKRNVRFMIFSCEAYGA